MTPGGIRAGVALAVLGLAVGCASPPPPVPANTAEFPVTWTLPGFEGPLLIAAPAGRQWKRRGNWEAFDGRIGSILLGPPRRTPPPMPDLFATIDPAAVPAALPGGGYRVYDSGSGPLWYRRFIRTGQDCVGFVRTGADAGDLGAWGYYCAAPGLALSSAELSSALDAIRWSVTHP